MLSRMKARFPSGGKAVMVVKPVSSTTSPFWDGMGAVDRRLCPQEPSSCPPLIGYTTTREIASHRSWRMSGCQRPRTKRKRAKGSWRLPAASTMGTRMAATARTVCLPGRTSRKDDRAARTAAARTAVMPSIRFSTTTADMQPTPAPSRSAA